MDHKTPDFPVHHQQPELTQTHVHWVSDTVQPSHFLPSPSSPTFNLSQHQDLFQWVITSGGQSIEATASATVLPMYIQDWVPLGLMVWISLLSKGLSGVSSKTVAQKHQFFGAQLSFWSNSHSDKSAHVSPRTTHFQVLDKSPVLGSGRDPPSCNKRTTFSMC